MAISPEISAIVANALREDLGSGDVTSVPIIPADRQLQGAFLVKAAGIVAGLGVVAEVFRQVDATIVFTALVADGDAIQPGDIVATVAGAGPGILIAERTALNFLQRMSGIATMAHTYQDAVAGTEPASWIRARPRPACARWTSWPCAWAAAQPSHRPVRHGADQRQPHRGGGRHRGRGGAGACGRHRPAHRGRGRPT